MIKRILEISSEPLYVAVRLDQLLLRPKSPDAEPRASVPCEDVGVLIVDQPRVTYSHQALTRLLQAGATIVLCGNNHLPAGILLPISQHTEVASRIQIQVDASRATKKRLWKQIVRAKIRNQAQNIPSVHPCRTRLLGMIPQIRSGDPDNFEAQAARLYWEAWRTDPAFRRRPEADDSTNGMLNYGYSVLRAAVARALVSAGLHPVLGLQHCNRSNPFCLADDLMEPMRPWVDRVVRQQVQAGAFELTPDTKRNLLGILHEPVRSGNASSGPLMVALHRTCTSLVRCLSREDKKLLLPRLVMEPQP